jgi:uncharacterized repeat protein (TIGR03803 family)
MKTSSCKFLPKIIPLAAAAGLMACPAFTLAFDQLKSFTPLMLNPVTGFNTNADGAYPVADLISSGDTLYGVTSAGGPGGSGTIFKWSLDGTGFAVLTNFSALKLNPNSGQYTNSDGARPQGRLFLSGATLFGTASAGGQYGYGTVFKLTTNGGGFTVIRHFAGGFGDGATPSVGVVMPGDTIIGATEAGGGVDQGTIFELATNGSSFSILHHFTLSTTNGARPKGELLRQGTTVYGTTYGGGSAGWGTVFKMNTNGTAFTLLKSFSSAPFGTNSDGADPAARLILSGGVLYGTTYYGGASNGTVFKIATDGTGFAVLKSFSPSSSDGFGLNTNSDGVNPDARLVLSGGALFGTTLYGGNGAGTIFKVNTNGSGFSVVRAFAEINGFGGVPAAGLLLVGTTFYGTTEFGGEGNSGTIFRLPVPGPQLAIAQAGANVVLTWSTNDIGFNLESTLALGPSAVWNAVAPLPIVVNGLYTVINPASATSRFYRLSQ